MYVTEDKIMCGLRSGSGAQLYPQSSYVHPTEKVCNYQYTHPSTKQCNYSYTHPTSKQCTWNPDLSNYATKSELSSVSSPWQLLQTFSGDESMTVISNTSYSFFLFTAKWSESSSRSSIRIGNNSDGGLFSVLNNDSSVLKNGTAFAYIRRILYNDSWGQGECSVHTVADAGSAMSFESMRINMSRNGGLELHVSGLSGFSGRLYGIA